VQELIRHQLPGLEVVRLETAGIDELVDIKPLEVRPGGHHEIHQQVYDNQRFRHHRSAAEVPVCAKGNEHPAVV